MRQIVLDTETTGLNYREGHRLIEIGCIELINRRITEKSYHSYLQPDREIEQGATRVHGITNEFLKGKPRFAEIVDELMAFITGAELVIHNADFDVGFINYELNLLKQGRKPLGHYCQILDTLSLARAKHPGQKNTLDILCKRYNIDNSKRQLHGALLDAQLLAEVYLAMTGGQESLLSLNNTVQDSSAAQLRPTVITRKLLTTIRPSPEELAAHENYLAHINKVSGGRCVWLSLSVSPEVE